MNGLVQGTAYVDRNRSAIDWARAEMQPENFDISHFLAVLTGYESIPGTSGNRWRYRFVRAVLTSPIGATWFEQIANAEDESLSDYRAFNLYEFPNTATSTQDGPLDTPPSTVGPVGASYDDVAETWSFPEASPALVVMHKMYAKDGAAIYFFSHPNPIRCLPEEEPV